LYSPKILANKLCSSFGRLAMRRGRDTLVTLFFIHGYVHILYVIYIIVHAYLCKCECVLSTLTGFGLPACMLARCSITLTVGCTSDGLHTIIRTHTHTLSLSHTQPGILHVFVCVQPTHPYNYSILCCPAHWITGSLKACNKLLLMCRRICRRRCCPRRSIPKAGERCNVKRSI